ncbi:HNH endonuclease [Streptomyces sp. NPDC058637]|uniref:HNH endonuclease n=1 Tax=Streptomyces sp. NPDC058637 TaxID=3346569 RepID=UPI00364F0EF9
MNETKTCTKCGQAKPKGEYGKSGTRDGKQLYRPLCKACKRAADAGYRAENAEARRECQAGYRAVNRTRWAHGEGDLNAPKQCRTTDGCGRWLKRGDFHVKRDRPDGRESYCRTCAAIRRANRGYRKACRKAHGEPVGATCYLCDSTITSDAVPHVDHLIPRSLGGGDEPFNLRWTHGRCNVKRNNRLSTLGEALRLMPGLLPADYPLVIANRNVIAV